ncbi:AsmA family protein [uncultured Sneathiella sp.]|uniref:AsmA family protein n=1 Tax=uncultured Sneathiella sp. TaxID=879315 RepID=UPI0025961FB5|nr:AsmA family protein [uncultured Sneathiella sp.]
MKKIVIAVIVILVVIVGLVVALPFIVPTDRIKQELILATNEATGRELAIDGDFSLSIFPTLGVTATSVSFSNAEGAADPNMASIDSLTVKLDLLPLVTGNVQVDEFVLTNPVINLEVDKNGKGNWEFDTAKAEAPKPAETSSDDGGAPDLGISGLNLGDVRIVDGVVNFIDQKGGTNINLSEINLAIELLGLDQPFEAKGSAVWNSEKTELDVKVGALQSILDNIETTTMVNLASKNINLNFDGQIKSTKPLNLGGTTTLDIPSVRELAAWTGTPLEGVSDTGFGPLKINGKLGVDDTKYSFSEASISFDEIVGAGDFSIDLGGKVPNIVGKLALETLDINPYLPAEQNGTSKAAAAPAQKTSTEKWDTTPIDLSALKSVNAKFDLSVQEILFQKIKIGASAVATNLKDGILDLALTEMNLYDGTGRATVRVNAQQPTLKITNAMTIENIQLNPLLTDAADFEKLEGKGMFQTDLSTSGKSQADMVSALNGTGQILFEDGSISGVNLAAMARNISTAFTSKGEEQKTDFAEISGTYQIANGILANNDLKMLNPFIRLTGSGTVELPPQTVNYRIEPKLVATTEGQGGGEATGVAVPILVTGSWDNLKYAPDLAGVLKNATNPEGVKKLIEGAKGSGDGVKDTLKGVKEKDPAAVKNLLDAAGGLLGGKKN